VSISQIVERIINYLKGGTSCQEEMEQDLPVKGQEQAREQVWEEEVVEEVEWAATNRVQDRVETAYAPIVVRRLHIKRVSLVTNKYALNVDHK